MGVVGVPVSVSLEVGTLPFSHRDPGWFQFCLPGHVKALRWSKKKR